MEFAEHVFPYLVHNVLERDDDVVRTTLSDQFRNFFSHCNGTSVITSSASSPFPTAVPSSNTSGIFGSEWNQCQIRLREQGNSKGVREWGGGGRKAGHIYFSETGHLAYCIHKGLLLKFKLIMSGVMRSNIRNKSELPVKVMKINIMITKGLKT